MTTQLEQNCTFCLEQLLCSFTGSVRSPPSSTHCPVVKTHKWPIETLKRSHRVPATSCNQEFWEMKGRQIADCLLCSCWRQWGLVSTAARGGERQTNWRRKVTPNKQAASIQSRNKKPVIERRKSERGTSKYCNGQTETFWCVFLVLLCYWH